VPTQYFAYGSNLEVDAMRERCPSARPLERAILPDWEFRINERGFATVVRHPGKTVHGALWELDPAAESALDAYEAIDEGLYRKEIHSVVVAGQAREVMVYLATHSRPGRPHSGYLEGILEAARSWGFPAEYLQELRSWLRLGHYGN
jgi:gamma-glutamylcyclotransferase (GGCT)/AIG2-like uncharacterized protein YtfP